MQRQNFFTDQVVGVQNLMDLQSAPEALFEYLLLDIVGKGVVNGLAVSLNSGLGVMISAGAAYMANGRRAAIQANRNLDLTTDKNGALNTPVQVGEERWLSIFAVFVEENSELVTTPQGDTIYYRTNDGILLEVVASPVAALGAGTRPALRSDAVLLADVKLIGFNAIENIYTDRRQNVLTLSAILSDLPAHVHPISDITNLQAELNSLSTAIGQRAPAVHSHTMDQVSGLGTALAGKAPNVHSHTIAQVTGLQAALDSKVEGNHTHTIGNITDLAYQLGQRAALVHEHNITNLKGSDATGNYTFSMSGGVIVQTKVS